MANQRSAVAPWRRRTARAAVVASFLLLLLGAPASAQQAVMTLEWDPSPSSVIGYRVYVGLEPGAYFKTYDIRNQTRFVFVDAQLGARYYFAVAARGEGGAISALSNEISGIAHTELLRPVLEPPDAFDGQFNGVVEPREPNSLRCAATRCGGTSVVAQGTGAITAIATVPDGRLIYVENERQVQIAHVAGSGQLAARSRYAGGEQLAAGTSVSLQAITVAPDFSASGHIFAAEATSRPDFTRELRIVRYRALGDVLDGGTTVIAGLPASAAAAPALAANRQADVFVAVPMDASRARRDPYAGQLLAFTPDGRTRSTDGAAAPIIGPAGASPVGLFWDSNRSHLWLASRDRQSLIRIDAPAGQQARVAAAVPLPLSPASVAFASDGKTVSVALISETGKLFVGLIDADRLQSFEEVLMPATGRTTAVAFNAAGEIYAAVQDDSRWMIFRIPRVVSAP